MKKIGFIGLGIMGESMCQRIIEVGGFDTMAFDVNKDQIDKLASVGAQKARTLEDIAKFSTHIIIMVPNNECVEAVIEGLLPHLNTGTTIIDMSTIDPNVSRTMARKVLDVGAVMLDAPVVKSKPAAISGQLGIYVGGEENRFKDIEPILKCMGQNIIYLGENGSGLTMKLCHNTLVAEIQNGVNEMMLLSSKAGINADNFVKAISYGGGQNFYLDGKWQSISNRNFSPAFPFEHMAKDIKLTKALAQSLGLRFDGVDNVDSIYEKGLENNFGREDFSASYKVVENNSKK